jgi:hypothetical protein
VDYPDTQFLCMKMIIHTSTSVICSCLTYLAAASSTRNSCFTKLLTWYSYSSSSCGSNASSKNMCAEIKIFSELILIFSQICIQRPSKATWKCSLYQQLPFIYRLTLYALFINRESETALYIQWFAIQRCPLMQVWLYLHINCARLFKMLVYIYSFLWFNKLHCIAWIFFNDFGYPMYALPRYNWNIVESGVKHQNPIYAFIFLVPKIFLLCFIQYITMSVPDDDYSRKNFMYTK